MGRDNKQKLELAKKMAEKINARKGDGKQSESQATAEAVMKGLAVKPAAAPTVSNKLLADQIAAKLNAKLGHVPMDRNETEQQAQVSFRDHKYFGDFGQDKAPMNTYLKNILRIWKECIKRNTKKNWKLMISLKVVVGRSLVEKQLEILPILVKPIYRLEESIIHLGKNPEKECSEI